MACRNHFKFCESFMALLQFSCENLEKLLGECSVLGISSSGLRSHANDCNLFYIKSKHSCKLSSRVLEFAFLTLHLP